MSIRKLRAGRVSTATASTYIGEGGTIFWDEASGILRLSDGTTPGGKVLGPAVATSGVTPPPFPYQGELWYNPTSKELWAYYNGSFRGTINAATTTALGGIKAGPGVVVASDGTLSLDSTGIPFNFGDFYAFTNTGASDGACLSSINLNQDINLVSNGSGDVNVVGSFNVHAVGATLEDSLTTEPIFRVKADGQVRMLVPLADYTTGAFEVVGNTSGVSFPPNQTGVILHVTGNTGLVARNYFDAVNNYGLLAGRRYNNTQTNPTRVLNNEVLFRIVGQGAVQASTEPATFNAYGPARISFIANENQTPTAQGGRIAFEITKNGTVADVGGTNTITVASMDAQNGLTATKFNGPLTGNVTGKADTAGNADTVTNGVYTNGSYANPSWITSLAASKVGLGNVTNESKATMFTSPTFTGTVAGVTKAMVGLGSVENTALSTSTYYIGTTQNTYNRASASQTLTGVSIDGNAGTVTNGVVTTGSYSDPTWLTISKSKVGLGSVENTALSTWPGTANITTVGTLTSGSIGTGFTAIPNSALAHSTISGVALGNTLNALTAGFGLKLTSGTTYDGSTALTLNKYEAITGPVTVVANAYTLDLTTSTGVVILDNANVGFTLTIQNPIVGKVVRVIVGGGMKGATTVTVSGLTAANSSNGAASFQATSGNASSVSVEFICTTTALTGVYMVCTGAK